MNTPEGGGEWEREIGECKQALSDVTVHAKMRDRAVSLLLLDCRANAVTYFCSNYHHPQQRADIKSQRDQAVMSLCHPFFNP